MKKLLGIFIFCFFLASCEQNKDKNTKAIENCADQATAGHWWDRQKMYQKLLDSAIASDDKIGIKQHKRNVELYENYRTKSLKHKMHMNDQFNMNFKKCEKEFKKNPYSFKAEYE